MKHNFNSVLSGLVLVIAIALLLGACSANSCPTEPLAQDTVPAGLSETEDESIVAATDNPLDSVEITLPNGIKRDRVSDTQESFVMGTSRAGGIFLLNCDDALLDDDVGLPASLEPTVVKAMEGIGLPEMEWYMGESSPYALVEYNMGNGQSEYIAYVVRGKTATYLVWMDRKQVNYDMEEAIMESLHSEDITEELNKISSQASWDALSDELAKHEYRFQITLPENFTRKDLTEDTALFYRGDQVVGGYAMTHFDKDILNNAKDHEEEIFNLMRDSVKDQIDLTDYTPELVTDQLVNVKFTNGDKECTQWLMSYGQRGTQYNIWMDTAALDEQTAMDIVWSGNLEQID